MSSACVAHRLHEPRHLRSIHRERNKDLSPPRGGASASASSAGVSSLRVFNRLTGNQVSKRAFIVAAALGVEIIRRRRGKNVPFGPPVGSVGQESRS